MTTARIFWLILITSILILISGCKFDPNKGLNWDADLVAPIASSEVGIFDVISDTSYIQNGTDNLLTVVFRDTIFSVTPSDFIEIPDTSLRQAFSLGSLEITSDTISQKITLGFMLRQLMAQGGTTGLFAQSIYSSQGQSQIVLPFTGITAPPYVVDASSFFEYAEIESGDLSLTITNRLPMGLANIIFQIKNQNLGNELIRDTFDHIAVNESKTRLYDMSGDTVESAMEANMLNLDIEQAQAIIDTNDYLRIAIVAVKMKAKTATASFPDQTVIDSNRVVEYRFGGGIELTKIGLKSGKIKVDAYSSIQDTIQFLYQFASAYDQNGQIPGIQNKIPPAPENGYSYKQFEQTLENVVIDLTQGPKGFNSYIERIKIDLIGSGNVVKFDQQDSVYLNFGLIDMIPNYIEGYIGKDTVVFTGSKAMEIFGDKFNVDRLYFTDPKLNVVLANSIGADAKIEMKNIRFSNTQNGQSMLLNTDLVNNAQYLNGPRLPNVGQVVNNTFSLNKDNSNLPDVIGMMPNEIKYNVKVVANYSGSPGVRNNFATDTSNISAFMDFEVPLHGLFENFVMTDTVNVNFSTSVKPQDIEKVEKATLKLKLQNQFPVQVTVDAVFYDEAGNLVKTMANAFVLQAGVPGANGIVTTPVESIYAQVFEGQDIQNILNKARKLSLRYRLDTKPLNENIKLYSTYKIKAKLIGNFTYKFGA
ncbi:MAG: hypothetical protein K1X92_14450 [Bacteroidia bacterium]|nr:hypothetical protein [Bacteroidia bacterium]